MKSPGPHPPSGFAMPASRDPVREVANLVRDLPPLISAKRCAAILGITVRTLQRWKSEQRIALIKTSASRSSRALVSRDELARFLVTLINASECSSGRNASVEE